MDKRLVKVLLRVVQMTEECFPGSKTLRGFLDDYRIGWTKGATYCFDATAKARIRELLQAQGIAPELAAICDRRITIPMQLGTDSLNVAVAAGIFLHHFTSEAAR